MKRIQFEREVTYTTTVVETCEIDVPSDVLNIEEYLEEDDKHWTAEVIYDEVMDEVLESFDDLRNIQEK